MTDIKAEIAQAEEKLNSTKLLARMLCGFNTPAYYGFIEDDEVNLRILKDQAIETKQEEVLKQIEREI